MDALAFTAVLKWDESKIHRNPARSPGGTGGQFARTMGSMSMGTLGIREANQANRLAAERALFDYQNRKQKPFNTPRGVGVQTAEEAEGAKAKTESQKVVTTLKEEAVADSDRIGEGANGALKVTLEGGLEAAFKAEINEIWGSRGFTNHDISSAITNRNFSLSEREAFAWELGEHLFGPEQNPVPETVLREEIEGIDLAEVEEYDDDNEVIWDSDELRQMYDSFREKAQDDAYGPVGEEMERLYQEAQQEHADDLGKRAEEVDEIWNELAEGFPENQQHGSPSMLRQHQVLPLGSQPPFKRMSAIESVDMLAVLDEAQVNPEGELTPGEKKDVREILLRHLNEGARELGDLDEEAAKEHLDRDHWIEEHADTEMRLLDEQIVSFTNWKEQNGYENEDRGNGGDRVKNPQAPHPRGGSLQKWEDMDGDTDDVNHDSLTRMAAFDYLVGAMDRHGGNLGWKDGHPVAIDNGYSMPAPLGSAPDSFTFWSEAATAWFAGGYGNPHMTPLPLRQALLKQLDDQEALQALINRHPLMNGEEREALFGRIDKMRKALETENGLFRLWSKQKLMGRMGYQSGW